MPIPKVYLIRVYYEDNVGNPQTCLKLGRTKQPLHERVVEFLRKMRVATGYKVKQYEVISILNSSNSIVIEFALHQNVEHLYFYTDSGLRRSFQGSNELLRDTAENSNVLRNPDSWYREGEYVVPYNFRETQRSAYGSVSNVV